MTAAQDRKGLTQHDKYVVARSMKLSFCYHSCKDQCSKRRESRLTLQCFPGLNILKFEACFMLHAEKRFSRHVLISKLNQCMKRICFLRIGLFEHAYSLILILCMKRK
jgi:hypothetical protein